MKYIGLLVFLFLIGCMPLHHVYKNTANLSDSILEDREIDFNYSFTEAAKQKILANYAKAASLLFHCLEIQPSNAAVYYQLADVYTSIGDANKALFFSRKCVKLEPKNIWYNLLLAKLYQSINNIDSTIYLYKHIIKIAPNNYEYKFNLSLLYLKNNQVKKALKLLNKIKEQNGLNEEIAISLYQVYNLKNDSYNCIKILNEALTLFPDETRFYGLMAEQYVSMDKFDLALQYYTKLLEIDPDNEKGLFSLIEYYRVLKDYLKVFEISKRFVSNADFPINDKIELFVNLLSNPEILTNQKDSISSLIKYAIGQNPAELKFHTIAADFFIKCNEYPQAKTELIYVAERNSDNYVVWEQLLYILNTMSDYKDIYKYTEQIITKFSDKPMVYLFRGIAAFQLKFYNESITSLNNGLKCTRSAKELNIQFYTFLGESYNALKDFPNSDLYFNKTLTVDPNNLYVLNNYSYYLSLRNEKLDIALSNIAKCINLQPKSPTYLDTYAWILFKSGNLSQAKFEIEKAIQYGGSGNNEIIEHYIEILYSLGNKTEAYRYYKILIEKGYSSEHLESLFKNESSK